MDDLNALETPYDGHVFRSRREARWAVFFNTAGIPWEYEAQGYDLGKAGWYLPDFRINADTPSELFFEVKGKTPTREELAKAEALTVQSKLPVYVYFEQVRLPAPASLVTMDEVTFWEQAEQEHERLIAREWLANPQLAAATLPEPSIRWVWSDEYKPTAYRAYVDRRTGIGRSKASPLWWTDCPHCGLVVPKLHAQVFGCPATDADIKVPDFRHATKRLQAAYDAARAARFDTIGARR